MPMDLFLPFNAIDDDRVYLAEDLAGLYASVMTNGVHPNPGTSFFVAAAGGWDLEISAGRCVIEGRLGAEQSNKTHTIDPPHGTLNRIDAVILRCDYSQRLMSTYIKSGTPSAHASPPALQRDADAYELCIARVYVASKATSITQADITDTRQDGALCGIITSLLQIDSATLFAQYDAIWQQWLGATQAEADAWMREQHTGFEAWRAQETQSYTAWSTAQKTEFTSWRNEQQDAFYTWYEDLQVTLDGDVAAKLTARVLAVENALAAQVPVVIPVTLPESAWELDATTGEYRQTVTDNRVSLGNYLYTAASTPESLEAYGESGVYLTSITASGKLVFSALDTPGDNLTATVVKEQAVM